MGTGSTAAPPQPGTAAMPALADLTHFQDCDYGETLKLQIISRSIFSPKVRQNNVRLGILF